MKNGHVSFRMDSSLSDDFKNKCVSMGRNQTSIVREMILAFVDGRLKIEKKIKEDFYE